MTAKIRKVWDKNQSYKKNIAIHLELYYSIMYIEIKQNRDISHK